MKKPNQRLHFTSLRAENEARRWRSRIGVGVAIGIGIERMWDGIRTREAGCVPLVAMLTKLGQRGYAVHENQVQYTVGVDSDTDSDPDAAGNQEQTDRQPLAPGDA